MNEFLENFHFLRPWLLLLLVIPFGFLGYMLSGGVKNSNWEKVCDSALLSYLLIRGKDNGRRLSGFLFWLGLVTGIIAAAGPSWKEKAMPALAMQNPVMVLLNMSSDMEQNDITPSRLSRAKIEIAEMLGQLPDIESGLIVYSDEPFVISPLSKDPALIVNLLEAVNPDIMPVNGDRPDRAIELAAERIRAAGFSSGNIVLFAAEGGIDGASALKAAEQAVAENIRVSAMDISSGGSVSLQELARTGGGQYEKVSAVSADRLASFIRANLSQVSGEDKNAASGWEDSGYYLMFVSMLCFLLMFRRGILSVAIFAFFAADASAGVWLSDAYEAHRLFDGGRYEEAAGKFDDPSWKGAAFYRAGDFEAAAEAFAEASGTESVYNHANALAKSGKIEEAIAGYEAVLQQQPEHEDAKFNLEYLKQQQNQQQQNQNQQQDNDQNQDQNQQQQQNQASGGDNNEGNEDQQPENQDSADQSSGSDDQPQDKDNEQQDQQSAEAQNQPTEQKREEAEKEDRNATAAGMKEGESDQPYDEEVQAREQRFRDIPDDAGGLLRAFIRKEYNKNRYGG